MTQETNDVVGRLRDSADTAESSFPEERDNDVFQRSLALTRQAADLIEKLDAECERAWEAYRIAHDQAMSNGDKAQSQSAHIAELEGVLGGIASFEANGSGANYYFEELWRFVDKARSSLTKDSTSATG